MRALTVLAAAVMTAFFAVATPAAPTTSPFSISLSPTSATVEQNAWINAVQISIVRDAGFTDSVTLTAAGVPDGLSASFGYQTDTGAELSLMTMGATTPGTSTITVTGTSGSVSSSATFVLTLTPQVPVVTQVVAGDGRATVGWAHVPGVPVTVTASPGGKTVTGSTSPTLVDGLTNGTAYTFTVTDTHDGATVTSPPSDPVTPTAPAADWSAPQTLAPAGTGTVALAADPGDAFGRVYAAWRQSGAIVLSTWQREQWSAPVIVAPSSGTSAPTIAAGADGRVLVAWAQDGEIQATFAGSGTVTNLSNTTADSSGPRAGWAAGLGYVVLWLEGVQDVGSLHLHSLVESHLTGSAWSAPSALYTPPQWTDPDVPVLSPATVAPLESDASSLIAAVAWLDTRAMRITSSAFEWTTAGWAQPAAAAGGGHCTTLAGGLPKGNPLVVALDCLGGFGVIRTSGGSTLAMGDSSEIGVIAGPAAATASGSALVTWSTDAGIFASTSDDGSTWTPAAPLTPDPGTPTSATDAGNGSTFVAYATPSGAIRTVHRGTPPTADFTLALAPTAQTVTQGETASATLDVERFGGFTDPVTLTVGAAPPGTTATLAGTTLTVATTSATPAGTYTLAVTGTSGTLSKTATTSLTVAAPPAPPPPPPPPPSGGGGGGGAGGGGGGGGGGASADLGLSGSVAPATANAGDTLVWTIHAADTDLGPAVDVVVDIQLSGNLSLVSSVASRGPGCTPLDNGRRLHCFLDWMSGDAPAADIVVTTTATGPGEYVVTSKVGQLVADARPTNDTLELRATTPVPPPVAPPSIRIVKATAARSGIVTVRVSIAGWTVNTKSVKNADEASGYWVISVDGRRQAVSRQPTLGRTRPLAPGRHTIRAQLAREDGVAIVPAVLSQRMTVVVPRRR